MIDWQQRFPLRLALSVDNSGSKSTGRNQGNLTLFYDNPLGLSDLLFASVGRSLEDHDPYGTRSSSFYYSVPFGYNQLTLSASNYTYHQTVAGYNTDYVYSGHSHTANIEWSRVILRTARSKTTAALSAFLYKSGNYVDSESVDIQRRRMVGWEAAVSHQQFIGQATLDGELRLHRGTGAYHALPAPERAFHEGTERPAIVTASLHVNVPFQIGNQSFRYVGQYRQQWARNKLVQRDRFSIGGRYTVRGYDGEYSLSADNGFLLRNELGWGFNILNTNHELYFGYDIGHVYGPFENYLAGQTLTGIIQGIRGSIKNFTYDLFISHPLSKPANFEADDIVGGFNFGMAF